VSIIETRTLADGGFVGRARSADTIPAMLDSGFVIPWSTWPEESLARFRERLLGEWSGPVDNSSSDRPD
jgi:hypothetical protein